MSFHALCLIEGTSHWPTIRVQNPGFKPRSSEIKPSCMVHCQRFSNRVSWNSQGAMKPHSHLPREEKRLLWAPFSAPWAATPLSHIGASMPMSFWGAIWFRFWWRQQPRWAKATLKTKHTETTVYGLPRWFLREQHYFWCLNWGNVEKAKTSLYTSYRTGCSWGLDRT